jgi:NitT/TauT family transport system substrate-binding protein
MNSGATDPLSRRKLLKLGGGAIAAGALLGTSGCGLLGGARDAGQSNGILEKSSIKIATLSDTAVAPLYLAEQAGYYQQEGLQVQLIEAASGPDALNGMIGGDYDVAYSSYVPFFAAQASGVAPLKIVCDAASLPPNAFSLMVAKNSPIKTVHDLPKKTIAVSDVHTISDLLVLSMLQAHGVSSDVQWARMPFPNMPTALAQGTVDAIAVVEPFVTLAARKVGALPLVDLGSGPAQDFPLTGYGTTAKFASANPKTLQAFQRAQTRATAAAQDRARIQPYVEQATKIDPQTAALITLLTMRSTADATRLGRVVDLMRQFQFVNTNVDVASMILPQVRA